MSQPSGTWIVGLIAGILMGVWLVGVGQADQAPPSAGQGAKPPAAPGQPREPRLPVDKKNITEGTDEDDALKSSDDDSWLFGKKGSDVLRTGKGRDVIDGGDGDDTIDAGDGNDVIDAGAGNDTVRGGGGNDTIDGGDNDDLLDGGAGNDDLDGGDDNDTLRGAAGDDVLAGADGDDALNGGAGSDRLSGDDGADTIFGGAGDDRVSGGDGDDLVDGGEGNDVLDAGQGNDTVRGGAGLDTLLGSSGADKLDGGDEQDILVGGDGRDVVNGGTGDDWLLGGAGADIISGGDGNDIIVVRAGDVPPADVEFVDGESGADRLVLNGIDSPQGDVLTDPWTGGTYQLRNIERIEYTHVFTDVSTTGTRSSPSLVLVNPSATAVEGRLVFSSDGGDLLVTAVGATAASDQMTFTIPPRGSITVDPIAQGNVPSGSAQVFANVPLAGVAASTLPLGAVNGLGESLFVDSVTVPVMEDGATGTGTGIVVVNGAVRSNVKLTLHARNGQELSADSAAIDLPPYGRRLLFVRDFFPSLGDFAGTMTVEGGIDRPQEGGPVAVTVVQRAGGTALVTHRPIPMSPSPSPRVLRFASFPNGGDTVSSLTLVNPSRFERARGTLVFFDENGAPRPLSVNGQSPAASVPYDLAPYGSAVFSTASGGVLRNGSARADSIEGTVGGVVRVTAPTTGPVDRGPSESLTSFIAPVSRDRATGQTTEILVSSTGAPATLQLALRDATGASVGTATLRVPANGQARRTLDEVFPAVSAARFQGTLAVTSDTAVTTGVTLLGARGQQAVPMPAVPLR